MRARQVCRWRDSAVVERGVDGTACVGIDQNLRADGDLRFTTKVTKHIKGDRQVREKFLRCNGGKTYTPVFAALVQRLCSASAGLVQRLWISLFSIA